MPTHIALLRGINVSGHNKILMADLRSLCVASGFGDVETYIQSGNIIFTSKDKSPAIEATLERAILERFALNISVIARDAKAWPVILASNPFSEAAVATPNFVMLCLSKLPPHPDAVAALRERAAHGEQIEYIGGKSGAIWVHYPNGAGISKLSPAFFDRVVGSPVTARNWRTVEKLSALSKN